MAEYIYETSRIIKLSRSPFSGVKRLERAFDRAVGSFSQENEVPLSQAFWSVTRQVAWQAKAIDFDKSIKLQKERFDAETHKLLMQVRRYQLLKRYLLSSGREFSAPLYTDEQRVLMDINPECAETVRKAEPLLRAWRGNNHASPLQEMLGNGLHRYPVLFRLDKH